MSDPFDWPAMAGSAALAGTRLQCEIGIWGKVHRQRSDYRWIARSRGFGGPYPDLNRRLRMGGEDRAARAVAWRAPWETGARDYFAIGAYPSRALDASGRSGVLEKQVLHWHSPDGPGIPVALAALLLLQAVADAHDRLWWGRVDEGDWERPDYALTLDTGDCPGPIVEPARLRSLVESGIDSLSRALDRQQLSAIYAGLLAGVRPVLIGGLADPLPPTALAALLLPLTPGQAQRCSLCAWVPSALIDPSDLGLNWDLAAVRQSGLAPVLAPNDLARGESLAAALLDREPGRLIGVHGHSPGSGRVATLARPDRPASGAIPDSGGSGHVILRAQAASGEHPVARMHLSPPGSDAGAGLRYLYRFADRIAPRRLDLQALRSDLASGGTIALPRAHEDPTGHPLIDWIGILASRVPNGVDGREWSFKIDQLRSAALCLLPHPRTLDLVGLPADPRVPALLAVLASDPEAQTPDLAAHGETALRRLLGHSRACPDAVLVQEICQWMKRWAAKTDRRDLACRLMPLID
jgi:hypothetical protein